MAKGAATRWKPPAAAPDSKDACPLPKLARNRLLGSGSGVARRGSLSRRPAPALAPRRAGPPRIRIRICGVPGLSLSPSTLSPPYPPLSLPLTHSLAMGKSDKSSKKEKKEVAAPAPVAAAAPAKKEKKSKVRCHSLTSAGEKHRAAFSFRAVSVSALFTR